MSWLPAQLTGLSGNAAPAVTGSHTSARVPRPTSLARRSAPCICTARPWIIDSPSPVPLPSSLVEKNGSVALRKVSASMPWPVSATTSRTYRPGASSASSRASTASTAIVSVPPSGIASRALTTRLSTASSIWFVSSRTQRQCRRQLHPQIDPRTDRALDEIGHAAHEVREVAGLDLEILAMRECQQPLRQRGAALRALQRAVDETHGSLVVGHPLAQQVEVAHHRHQQVVEIVRHAAGELADGFHFLRLAQLPLGAFPLLDLAQHGRMRRLAVPACARRRALPASR